MESAKKLLGTLEAKLEAAKVALAAEFPALKNYWDSRLRAIFDAYAEGEKKRADISKDKATILFVRL